MRFGKNLVEDAERTRDMFWVKKNYSSNYSYLSNLLVDHQMSLLAYNTAGNYPKVNI